MSDPTPAAGGLTEAERRLRRHLYETTGGLGLPDLDAVLDERAARVTAAVEAELEAYRAEDLREREWAAFQRESDVRCSYCDLRYGEREEYSCNSLRGHRYDEAMLDEARRLDDPAIPRAALSSAGTDALHRERAKAAAEALREAADELEALPSYRFEGGEDHYGDDRIHAYGRDEEAERIAIWLRDRAAAVSPEGGDGA